MAYKPITQSPDTANAHAALLTRPIVLQLLGTGATRFKQGVREGWLPRPVRFGSSSRWPAAEIRSIVNAITSGKSTPADLRPIVAAMHSRRTEGGDA
jgi:predicted DNA-binding transcriptional regulator AlpA